MPKEQTINASSVKKTDIITFSTNGHISVKTGTEYRESLHQDNTTIIQIIM